MLFHDRRHPRDLGPAHVEAFLTHLATDQHVSASTQNQALAAIPPELDGSTVGRWTAFGPCGAEPIREIFRRGGHKRQWPR
ncbi:site-specific integrase [Sorangium sp. So ce128]|uniref:site-specific integrase n=1 Tax=Sorangium sp. So ce128 TaxID=3133281 RepID=UPI003F61F8F8